MALRLALAQINATVGDLEGNRDAIVARIAEARSVHADILIFPELVVTGYPPEDLLLKPSFIAAAERTVGEIAAATRGLTVIVGTPHADGDLYNTAAILHDGYVVARYYKQCLPNYGVFDENRYFRAGEGVSVFRRGATTIGLSVCEDIWYPDGPPTAQAMQGGAEVLINLSSSPYYCGKGATRERMLQTRAADKLAFVAYCNLVGGQDELVFDGQSMVCGPDGAVLVRAAQFREELLVVDVDPAIAFQRRLQEPRPRKAQRIGSDVRVVNLPNLPPISRSTSPCTHGAPRLATPLNPLTEVYEALVLGTRDYVRKNGFSCVVIGLSGGVDSSLVAMIAVDALGPERVTGIAMPTRYSSTHSVMDAEVLALNLGIAFRVVPVDAPFQSFLDLLSPIFDGRPTGLTEENLQPRVRGTILMAISNKTGALVLTTGNKSEVSVGYSTLYGDTAGGFAVIKDVPKTLVYALCRSRNAVAGRDLIPQSVLDKPPSAELRPEQKDTDSLPPYDVLDPILGAYVEENHSAVAIAQRGFDPVTVTRVVRLVDRSEYKRRQSPPGVKITPRAFGRDWRLPITSRYSESAEESDEGRISG